MKKVIGTLAAVALFAAPALAEPTKRIIPRGSYTIQPADASEGTRGINDDGIYNNLHSGEAQSQYRIPNNTGTFVGDDLHMTAPGTAMTTFRWVYSDPGNTTNGGGASHSSTLLFSNNTAGDGGAALSFATFSSGTSTGLTAAFLITGLPNATVGNPGGGWLITVGLPGINTGPDIWVGLSSNSTTVSGPNTLGLRGTSLSPAVGSSHNLHYEGFFTGPTATSFFTVPNGGSFRMVVLPEPAVAGLLALGGLVVLRRRAR